MVGLGDVWLTQAVDLVTYVRKGAERAHFLAPSTLIIKITEKRAKEDPFPMC